MGLLNESDVERLETLKNILRHEGYSGSVIFLNDLIQRLAKLLDNINGT